MHKRPHAIIYGSFSTNLDNTIVLSDDLLATSIILIGILNVQIPQLY